MAAVVPVDAAEEDEKGQSREKSSQATFLKEIDEKSSKNMFDGQERMMVFMLKY